MLTDRSPCYALTGSRRCRPIKGSISPAPGAASRDPEESMRKPLVLWMSLAAAVAVPACAQAQAADTVLVNGKIITLDGAATVAQGLAIRDGMVLAVGSNDEMKRHAEP